MALMQHLYAQTSPVVIPGTITQNETDYSMTEILDNLNIVTNQNFSATPGMSGDLMSMFQTPQGVYADSKKPLLYLRLMPKDTFKVLPFNMSGAVKIYIVNLKTQEKIIQDHLLKVEKSEVVVLNRQYGIPEVIYIFTFTDFGISSLPKGLYEIQLVYSNTVKTEDCWTGVIKSNIINLEIQ